MWRRRWCDKVRLVFLFQIGQTIPEARQIRRAPRHLTKRPRHPQPPQRAGAGISDRAQRKAARVLVGLRSQLLGREMTLCMDCRSRAAGSELGCHVTFPVVCRQCCLVIFCISQKPVSRYGCGICGQVTSGSGREDPSCQEAHMLYLRYHRSLSGNENLLFVFQLVQVFQK